VPAAETANCADDQLMNWLLRGGRLTAAASEVDVSTRSLVFFSQQPFGIAAVADSAICWQFDL